MADVDPQPIVSAPGLVTAIAQKQRAAPVPAQPVQARPIPRNEAKVERVGAVPPATIATPQADDQDDGPEPFDIAARMAPPWLISTIFHMLGLIILGLWMTVTKSADEALIEIDVRDVYTELGDQLLDDSVQFTTPTPDPEVEKSVLALGNLPEISDPLASPPPTPFIPSAETTVRNFPAPTIGYALSGREVGRRKALLGAYGGTRATEDAVELALAWLKRNQRPDGSWSLVGPYKDGSYSENTVAATAMALLAFQGAGHTHQQGGYSSVVDRGWKALLKMQDSEGMFTNNAVPAYHLLYSHGQATIAVCEAFGMTKDPKMQAAAERAVRFCVRNQAPQGGWRYEVRIDSDTSVTGWILMGLQSARMAGIEVPQATFDNVSKFLDTVSRDDGTRYVYRPDEPLEGPTMTAEALLCRQYLGWKRDDPRLVNGAAYLLTERVGEGEQNAYYWYYATQVCHHMEGDVWKKWNAAMRQVLPAAQSKDGAEAGSWDPGTDKWGKNAGRLYQTCMSTYMLEVYYRHMPIYTRLYEEKP
jgi:hypothetical protein